MPLTRDKVTIASRVMLPTYPAFALYIGIVYAFDPGARLAGSAAFPILPTPLWGSGFVVVGALQVVALLSRKRRLYEYGLAPMMAWLLIWSAALAWSAIFDGTSLSAPAFPLVIAVACWASMLSLLAGEVS